MKQYENEGNVAFTAHAKKKNFGGLRNKGRAGAQGKKGKCYTFHKTGHYARVRRILLGMMTTTITGGMEIKGTTRSKERGRIPLVEMGNLTKGREIPGMRNQMLLMIKEMNSCICPLCCISTRHYGF